MSAKLVAARDLGDEFDDAPAQLRVRDTGEGSGQRASAVRREEVGMVISPWRSLDARLAVTDCQ